MKKVRIIKRTNVDGRIEYVIQQRSLFTWADTWFEISYARCQRSAYDDYEEAQKNLCYFDGTNVKEEVVG